MAINIQISFIKKKTVPAIFKTNANCQQQHSFRYRITQSNNTHTSFKRRESHFSSAIYRIILFQHFIKASLSGIHNVQNSSSKLFPILEITAPGSSWHPYTTSYHTEMVQELCYPPIMVILAESLTTLNSAGRHLGHMHMQSSYIPLSAFVLSVTCIYQVHTYH